MSPEGPTVAEANEEIQGGASRPAYFLQSEQALGWHGPRGSAWGLEANETRGARLNRKLFLSVPDQLP
jgi:hypothetical protein